VRASRIALLAAAACAVPPAAGPLSSDEGPRASVAPAFSGRYKLVLTISRGCPASMQVGPLTATMDVKEAAVTQGSEVSGQSASPSEAPDDGRFVLLRQGDRLHGAFGSGEALGLATTEGYLLWVRLMTDGTAATATGGRSRESGTAFGEVDLGFVSDPAAESTNCSGVLDHQWSLEPM
jgi:hypothetical protein